MSVSKLLVKLICLTANTQGLLGVGDTLLLSGGLTFGLEGDGLEGEGEGDGLAGGGDGGVNTEPSTHVKTSNMCISPYNAPPNVVPA